MKKLKADHDTLLQQLAESKKKQEDQHDDRIRQLKQKLQSQQNVVSLSRSTMETAQDASLLKALQSFVLESLAGSLEDTDAVPEVDPKAVEFSINKIPTSGVLTETKFSNTRYLKLSCNELLKKKISSNRTSRFGIGFNCFDFIKGDVWCAENHSGSECIKVFSTSGTQKATLKYDSVKQIRSFTPFRGNVIVAASNGLFFVTLDAHYSVTHIIDGDYCDVTVADDNTTVYVLTCDESNQVKVLTYLRHSKNFVVDRRFALHGNYPPYRFTNTIIVTSSHVFVAQRSGHVIEQYTTDGALVKVHGRQGSKLGELIMPLLCHSDYKGNLLIADCNNSRLVILKSDGTFHHLLQQPPNKCIHCARLYDGLLYVSVWDDQSIQVFGVD